jgi:FlaA1/EpsC-like NDP-sugar epimerase
MTRFNISLEDGVDLVLWAIANAWGGEIFVPKIPSYRVTDVAKAVDGGCEHRIVGIRPGEKLHEEMITASDSFNTVDMGRYFAILPSGGQYALTDYCRQMGAAPVAPGFSYNSGTNTSFLTVEELKKLIATHVAYATSRDA